MASTSSSIGGISFPAATDICFSRRRCRHLGEFRGLKVLNPLGSGNRRVLRLAPPDLRLSPYGDVTAKASTVGQGASVDGSESLAANAAVPQLQADAVALGAIAADMGPMGDVFFTEEDDELDLDCPSEGFNSIPEAIEDIRRGKYVIVVDDEDRENEGDLIMAASMVTPDAMAFIVRHGTGIVCVGMKEEDLDRLELPLMVSTKENEEKLCTTFTVSVLSWANDDSEENAIAPACDVLGDAFGVLERRMFDHQARLRRH